MNYIQEPNQIYVLNPQGERIAEVLFPKQSDSVVVINRTFVDPTLRGQGVANTLLEMAYASIEAQNLKAIPTCCYAVTWFKRYPKRQILLAPGVDLNKPEGLTEAACSI